MEQVPEWTQRPLMAPRGLDGAAGAFIVVSVMVTLSHASLPFYATVSGALSYPNAEPVEQTPLDHRLWRSLPLVFCEQGL
jgi:hypothetical protein